MFQKTFINNILWILPTFFSALVLYRVDELRNDITKNSSLAHEANAVTANFKDSINEDVEMVLCVKSKSEDIMGADQEDPKLIQYIREELLHPPSVLPYNLKDPQKTDFSQKGQSIHANVKYFHAKKDGFFIEAGAANGEYLSNSLYFERELGWRGILIEPYDKSHKAILDKHRKAYSINAALSLTPQVSEVKFNFVTHSAELSHITKKKTGGTPVIALPLYAIILALRVEVIDFLSLDIEAYEVKVLKTLPWDKVKFRLMCIEINHIPEGVSELTKYLEGKGYKFLGVRDVDAWYGWPSLLD